MGSPADIFFNDVVKNEYFINLYRKMTLCYGQHLFNKNELGSFSKKEYIDLLRFADILACSTDLEKSGEHKNYAQTVAVVLGILFPNNETIDMYRKNIFRKTSNHLALEHIKIDLPIDYEDNLFEEVANDYLTIPGDEKKRFFPQQKKVYDRLSDDVYSYSAPTSMGKTLLVQEFIKQKIKGDCDRINYVLLIPSKALINELKSKLIKELKEFLDDKKYRVISTVGDLALEREDLNYIFVVTPERLLYLLIHKPELKIGYLFVDESHKLSCKGPRSTFYYQVINILRNRKHVPKIIFASPNIPNPDVYLKTISDDESGKQHSYGTFFSPVSQLKFLVDLESESISAFNELTKTLEKIELDTEAVYFGGITREESFKSIINKIVFSNGQQPKKTIIYFQAKATAFRYAREIANSIEEKVKDEKLLSLAKEIRQEIHSEFELASFIEKGVAVHVGYLPLSIRIQIEEYFKEGAIAILFCTSTLMEGVNLPADNLIITTIKNGLAKLTQVEFRNLSGRVGRLEYNLYGNVYMVAGLGSTASDFFPYITEDIPKQELSVSKELNKNSKRYIIEQLKRGSTDFDKYVQSQTLENAKTMRKFGLILLSDIIKGRRGVVFREFRTVMQPEDVQIIRDAFKETVKDIDDNIDVSLDQVLTLRKDYINEGVKYPSEINKSTVQGFLEDLYYAFNWPKYELKHADLGGYNNLSWFAVLLTEWMKGMPLSLIISNSIRHYEENPSKFYIGVEQVNFERKKVEHVNVVIQDTLDAINDVITFSIPNYFLCFSTEYKKHYGIDTLENDWYEYVEYGTTDKYTIFLQKVGFTREAATYILSSDDRKCCILDKGKRIFISNKLWNLVKEDVLLEMNEISINSPDLFVDN